MVAEVKRVRAALCRPPPAPTHVCTTPGEPVSSSPQQLAVPTDTGVRRRPSFHFGARFLTWNKDENLDALHWSASGGAVSMSTGDLHSVKRAAHAWSRRMQAHERVCGRRVEGTHGTALRTLARQPGTRAAPSQGCCARTGQRPPRGAPEERPPWQAAHSSDTAGRGQTR